MATTTKIPKEIEDKLLAAAKTWVRGAARLLLVPYRDEQIERISDNILHTLPEFGRGQKLCVKHHRSPPVSHLGPHWVVRKLVRFGPFEYTPRILFMHASEDLAKTEAKRLAAKHPGTRFAVYASCASYRVEKPASEPASEKEAAD